MLTDDMKRPESFEMVTDKVKNKLGGQTHRYGGDGEKRRKMYL